MQSRGTSNLAVSILGPNLLSRLKKLVIISCRLLVYRIFQYSSCSHLKFTYNNSSKATIMDYATKVHICKSEPISSKINRYCLSTKQDFHGFFEFKMKHEKSSENTIQKFKSFRILKEILRISDIF